MEKLNLTETTKILTDKLETWYELIISSIPNFALAIFILIVFVFMAKLSKKIVLKLINNRIQSQSLVNLISTICYVTVLSIGLFIALGILHLDKTVTSLLAGAGVIGLALGFAFQEIASNFVSGIFITLRRPYSIGDIIENNGYFGVVKRVDLRTTTIRTFDGIDILIPNKMLFTEPLKNYNRNPERRLDISVGVGYETDLEKAADIAKKTLENVEGRIKDKEIEIYYKEFGASSINFDARIWIEYPAQNNFLRTQHEAIVKIKKAFDENDINIPFPIRTLDLKMDTFKKIETRLETLNLKQDNQ